MCRGNTPGLQHMMVQKGDVYYFIESNVTDVLHFVTVKYSLQQSDNRTSL